MLLSKEGKFDIYMLTALMYCFFEFLSVRNYVLIFITTLLPCPSFCVPDRDRDTRAEDNYETGVCITMCMYVRM